MIPEARKEKSRILVFLIKKYDMIGIIMIINNTGRIDNEKNILWNCGTFKCSDA